MNFSGKSFVADWPNVIFQMFDAGITVVSWKRHRLAHVIFHDFVGTPQFWCDLHSNVWKTRNYQHRWSLCVCIFIPVEGRNGYSAVRVRHSVKVPYIGSIHWFNTSRYSGKIMRITMAIGENQWMHGKQLLLLSIVELMKTTKTRLQLNVSPFVRHWAYGKENVNCSHFRHCSIEQLVALLLHVQLYVYGYM